MGVPPRYETRISEEPEFWTNTRSIRHWMSMGPERSMVPRLLSHAAIGQASSATRARRARMRALFMFPPFDGRICARVIQLHQGRRPRALPIVYGTAFGDSLTCCRTV